jgi:hypothetical protein
MARLSALALSLSFSCVAALRVIPHPLGAVPTPSPQQLKYGGTISALIHFNMATFFHDGDPGFVDPFLRFILVMHFFASSTRSTSRQVLC